MLVTRRGQPFCALVTVQDLEQLEQLERGEAKPDVPSLAELFLGDRRRGRGRGPYG